jgi:hypothetical protein
MLKPLIFSKTFSLQAPPRRDRVASIFAWSSAKVVELKAPMRTAAVMPRMTFFSWVSLLVLAYWFMIRSQNPKNAARRSACADAPIDAFWA